MKSRVFLLRLLFLVVTVPAVILACPTEQASAALLSTEGFHTYLDWDGWRYKLTHGVEEVLPEGYSPAGVLENTPGQTHKLAGQPFYTSQTSPGVVYVLTERGYGAWTVVSVTDPAAAFDEASRQALLARFDVEDVEVFQAIPVTDGTDGLLGIVQYRRPDSKQIFLCFVTESGCYTAWLPEVWTQAPGTAVGYAGENAVTFVTSNRSSVPATRWMFTYGQQDGVPRIKASWEILPGFGLVMSSYRLSPLTHSTSAYTFLYDRYGDYNWNVLRTEHYTVPPEDGSDLQLWEIRRCGLMASMTLPAGQTFPSAEALHQGGFEFVHRMQADGTLTLYAFDDAQSPDRYAADLWEQDGLTVEENLLKLSQFTYYDLMVDENGLPRDTTEEITDLFHRLKTDPADAAARQELIYYRNHTLLYAFQRLLNGTADGDADLLWEIAQEIMGGCPIEGDFAASQEAFDAWQQQVMTQYNANPFYLSSLRSASPEEIVAGLSIAPAFYP